tara:strand:+ start:252 stop:665 length:414 start_codon:yes stop_codon:yes gene_type:complete
MVQYVKKLFDGDRKAVFSFTAKIASTTAETYNVDASALNARNDGTACTYVDINKMWWSVNNTAVTKPLLLEWVNSGTNPIAWSCNYAEDQDFSSVGGLLNTKASNYTGDVLINFSSVTDNDTASITVEFLKRYSSIS